jgi:cysteine desulfurase
LRIDSREALQLPLYLDYNATSPVHPEVLDLMVHVYREEYGNASSRTHTFGQRAGQIVSVARQQVASLLGVGTGEVVFTSGATEADNLAILGLAKWGAKHGRRHIVSTQIEHKAVLEPLRALTGGGFDVDLVGVDETGRVKTSDVLDRVRPDTLLVSIMHANNETGVIQPVDEIGAALRGTDVFFHIDAAQTAGKLVPEVRSICYDLLSLSAHKMGGPQGVGALVIRRGTAGIPPLEPLMYGGGQEKGFRPGTLPTALIAGLGRAAEYSSKHHTESFAAVSGINAEVLRQLRPCEFVRNGSVEFGMPNCINLSFCGVDAEALMLQVRERLAVSNGSACTSHSYAPSHVLTAMNLSPDRIREAIRLSWAPMDAVFSLDDLVETVLSWQRCR